ncbi:DHA2 family efflux MFS transporter permease subunit [Limosilactobacillus reuteri]|jgi:EmrB/QacA subfamily drug resistance transporter|uniref:DSBA oxidoreductase n=1 Tax=Limosilactobacillus reuteri TaxID=1598 RepID=A0A073JKN3_LIMRT|nr:DHA2 family efflux MFS transporter permease subunit [Limosilactobacillus reuteri]AXX73435.1 DHA2 family efflux MFS transporter permease subunit [Limosilactobacillus reuteri]KEK14551.1 DSBA oxidoreductase [Limosilactobacillus reuteri]MCC4331027.1 DHA2 family efflux MFS transporter permease subunit [Limosilactobacillus reuteri]MCC4342304.1 DHA2 family efflux MFS transporter permease subunit [Limosilactobacillus reuteri]MCC4343698.1 DHA2 family efflux MFS transporter permease subunit [Limosila
MKNQRISHALVIMVFGTFFGLLCSTLMNIALPTFMNVFHISEAQVQWVTNGYMLVNALMIPVSSFLIKRFPFKNLFIIFSGIFLLGTIIGAIAWSFNLVVIARMIQALGAGMMMPLVNVLAIRYAKPGKKGQIMGIIGLAFNCAPILGPAISGFLLHFFSWRYLFLLIIPFAVITLLLSFFLLPKIPHNEHPRFNTLALILITGGLWSLLMGLSNVSNNHLLSFNVAGYVLIGLVFLLLFFLNQRHSNRQLINFGIFSHKQFVFATVINMLITSTMYGNAILIPLLVQIVLGKSTVISAIAVLPGAILTGLLSTTSGRFYDIYPIKILVGTGLIIDIIGTIGQAAIGARSSVLMITLFQTIRQFGLVTMLIPLQTQALSLLPNEIVPDAVATFNTLRQIAAAFGTALIVSIVGIVNHLVHNPSSHLGIQAGFLLCLCLLLTSLYLSTKLYHKISSQAQLENA